MTDVLVEPRFEAGGDGSFHLDFDGLDRTLELFLEAGEHSRVAFLAVLALLKNGRLETDIERKGESVSGLLDSVFLPIRSLDRKKENTRGFVVTYSFARESKR